ncbi:GNAT family N-acetyltransferase [Bifidobacterium callitrichidarum]|nr:GNAT family N-acetyltransferase [Bifidobacterium callitrichidarum]
MRLLIQEYRSDDALQTLELFRRSVVGLASHDYDERQIQAWAGHTGTVRQWDRRRLAANTWVAAAETGTDGADRADGTGVGAAIAGFIDLDETGYIDMLFVDPSHARQGVASTLLAEADWHAAAHGISGLSVHASITARPFFEHHGFHVEGIRHPAIGDVSFTNYLMVRP